MMIPEINGCKNRSLEVSLIFSVHLHYHYVQRICTSVMLEVHGGYTSAVSLLVKMPIITFKLV